MKNLPDEVAALLRLWPDYRPTPLIELPGLAKECGVGEIMAKLEADRPLGNFKSLGGMYAGLRALARAAGLPSLETLVARRGAPKLPRLICASDGNHGLAVAAAAEMAGAPSRIFLHKGVPPERADRIAARGADIQWIEGTYDDAVLAASRSASAGEGLLIADTSDDPGDPALGDVMQGYELIAAELAGQLAERRPTHLFVQAGVGGLAAALVKGLADRQLLPERILVVEPKRAACVARALATGKPELIEGHLGTSAEMLSCGLASAPAVEILLQYSAESLVVGEDRLAEAVVTLDRAGGQRPRNPGRQDWRDCWRPPPVRKRGTLWVSTVRQLCF
ncbi:MAG: pyridoxal-phosphate dependent enzyme [Sphingosinicella sp.]|nr:pyridoxal-phosphate dependent enzyme [Sphingosinicella sp.]